MANCRREPSRPEVHNSALYFLRHLHFVLFSCAPRPHNSTIMPLLYPKILISNALKGRFLYGISATIVRRSILLLTNGFCMNANVMKSLFGGANIECVNSELHAIFLAIFLHLTMGWGWESINKILQQLYASDVFKEIRDKVQKSRLVLRN